MVRGNGNDRIIATWTAAVVHQHRRLGLRCLAGNSPAPITRGQAAALPLSITFSSTTIPGTTQSPGPALPVRADRTRSEVAQESCRAAK